MKWLLDAMGWPLGPEPDPVERLLRNLKGKSAPPFRLDTLDGRTVSLAGYKGKALLVNFWATWCGECLVEMPLLAKLGEQYASQGFEILGVLTDDAAPGRIRTILRRSGVGYPIAKCDHATAQKYGGLPFLPVSFYISRGGKVVDVVTGANSKGEIEQLVRKTLAVTQRGR